MFYSSITSKYRQSLTNKYLVIYCGFLHALSSFSVDILLPVFPDISTDLSTPMTLIKMTVTFYLFTFGIGQLFFGRISDWLGRRPAIIIGLWIYLGGTVIAAAAFDVEVLLMGRLAQGVGAGGVFVSARAILRDLYSGRELARSLATATAIFSIGPLLAPFLGYCLGALFGWRWVFIANIVFAVALLWMAYQNVAETRQQTDSPLTWVASLQRFFHYRQSLFFLLICAWISIAMHFLLANSAQLYDHHFGVSGWLFALLFATHGIGIILGQIVNRALIQKIGAVNSAIWAAVLLTIASVALLVLALFEVLTIVGFVLLIFLFATGFLVVVSNATALAMDPHGRMAGFASSILGCGTMVIGALGATGLTWLTDGALLPWVIASSSISVVTLIALFVWREMAREGDTNINSP